MKSRIFSFLVILSFLLAASAPASFSKGKTAASKKSAVTMVKTNDVKSDSTKSTDKNKSTMHASGNKTWSKTHSKKHSTTLRNKTSKSDTSKTSSSSKTKKTY